MTKINKLKVFEGIVPNKKTQSDNDFAQYIYTFLHYSATLPSGINNLTSQLDTFGEEVTVLHNDLKNRAPSSGGYSQAYLDNAFSLKVNAADLEQLSKHNHDTQYLGISEKAKDSSKLNGKNASYYAVLTHNHDAQYLGLNEKAEDSKLLDGIKSDYFKGLNYGSNGQDPNTTTMPYITTLHDHCPTSSQYWHIRTQFYSNISSGANCAQIAISYEGVFGCFTRSSYNGIWTDWHNMITPLSDSVTSSSKSVAATSYSVKKAYDEATKLPTHGTVGSYALLAYTSYNTTITRGWTYPGSKMSYTGWGMKNTQTILDIYSTGYSERPAGTWRAMGTCRTAHPEIFPATLFVRIA